MAVPTSFSAPAEVADVVGVGDRLAAGGDDLVDHLLGGAGVAARRRRIEPPRSLTTTLGPLGGQQQRVLAADAPARPGHDRDSSVTDAHRTTSALSDGYSPDFQPLGT